jgi:hypothetical protein
VPIRFIDSRGEEWGRVSLIDNKLVATDPELQIFVDNWLERKGDEREFMAKYHDAQWGRSASEWVDD